MNNTNLFYGNLTIQEEEEVNSIFAEIHRVSEYFKGQQFTFPNDDETYMELMKLYRLVDENYAQPDKVFQAQDIDLNRYLLNESNNCTAVSISLFTPPRTSPIPKVSLRSFHLLSLVSKIVFNSSNVGIVPSLV